MIRFVSFVLPLLALPLRTVALFSKYILSYADDVDFMVYLNEEIGRIKKVVSEASLKDSEKTQLIQKIDELKNKPVDKEIIESVLSFQSLAKELNS